MRMVRYYQRNITKMVRKILDIGILEIQKGGRGNTAKKPSELIWSKTPTTRSIPSLSSEIGWTLL